MVLIIQYWVHWYDDGAGIMFHLLFGVVVVVGGGGLWFGGVHCN